MSNELATPDGRVGSWVEAEIGRDAGRLPRELREKADKGDEAAIREVRQFMGRPVAAEHWGDVGRRTLQRWVRLYAGECKSTGFAIANHASNLRADLAGPNPTRLEVMLAERVVSCWLIASFAEKLLAESLTQPKFAAALRFMLQMGNQAHRQMMTAATTLAKVRRCRLPEVLALVNVQAPGPPAPPEPRVVDAAPEAGV